MIKKIKQLFCRRKKYGYLVSYNYKNSDGVGFGYITLSSTNKYLVISEGNDIYKAIEDGIGTESAIVIISINRICPTSFNSNK